MDKRLPLALFLSFLVLLAWSTFFAPKPEPRQPGSGPEAAGPQAAAPEAGPAAQQPTPPQAEDVPPAPTIGPVLGDDEERTLELEIGTPGEPGSYLARFTNRGARLTELRLGNYFDAARLGQEQQHEREHWVELLTSVPTPGGMSGSLGLRANASARPYVRTPLESALWSMRELAPGEDPDGRPGVVFELAQGSGIRLAKRVLFEPESYHMHVQLALENTGLDEAERTLSFLLTPAEVVPQEAGDKYYIEPQAVYAGQTVEAFKRGERPRLDAKLRSDKGQPPDGQFDAPSEVTRFAGVHNKYFAVLLRGEDDAARATLRGAMWRRLRDSVWAEQNPTKADRAWHFMATDVLLDLRLPPRGETRRWDYVVFAGPKERELLVNDDPAHAVLIDKDLGFFDGIARALLAVLGFFEGLTGNWGIAIILLTLSVRALLFPVNRRSQTAMSRYSAKMKRLQPQIEELKKRHEKDPQKLRAAQAELMQKEGAFPPLGGCLPMFVQLPIFFGLFQALRTSFDLRQAPFFFWITDLSKPDRLMRIDLHGIPLIGTIEFLNVLPPLMVVLWVLQQMTMPKPADEQAAKMQRMMMFMPVVMGVFLYNYAAGLSLYMITQSTLGIFEQHVIKRVWPVDDTEPPKKQRKPTGFMARLMERAQEAQRQQQQRQRRLGGGGGGGKGGKAGRR